MSKNLPEPQQQSEEIDLGQLFKLIGNAFDRFFKFIGKLLNKFFLAFVWLVFFIKKHVLKLVIAAILGVVIGILLEKSSKPAYKSTMVVKQNYDTGEILYNTIEYYNELISGGDSLSLGRALKISPNEAGTILKIDVKSNLNENQKLQHFNEYIKSIDSSLSKTLKYENFLKNSNDFEHQYQKITLKARTNINFDEILTQIIDNIITNPFFKRHQLKDSLEVVGREKAIMESLTKAESLQEIYEEVLKRPADNSTSGTTSINFNGRENQNITKEFELYNKDLELRRELVDLEREKNDIAEIIEIISSKKDIGTRDNLKKVFGIKFSRSIDYSLFLLGVVFSLLLLKEFIVYLERFKNKI